MKRSTKSGIAVVAAGALFAVGGMSTSMAAKLITGKEIASNTVTKRNLAPESVGRSEMKSELLDSLRGTAGTAGAAGVAGAKGDTGAKGEKGDTGAKGEKGDTGAKGDKGDTGTVVYQGANWSIVHRNVIGNGDAGLQSGPRGAGSLGDGALMIRTGSNQDKTAFGNEVDFVGQSLSTLSTVSYWAYTTGENNGRYAENNVGIAFEIDPTGPDAAGPNYTSLVYVPVAAPSNAWTKQDASTAARWFMTGAAGTGSCNQGPEGYCTLAQVQAKFPNASILTVQLTKGRDYAFSGAADRLQINNDLYDFEPFGVVKSSL